MIPGRRVRLAAVSYLNTRPLIQPLLTGEVEGYDVTVDLPSRLPAMLEAGAADLGLVPAAYCARRPDLHIAPGAGIACRGPVRSILLLTRGELGDCRRIAATTSSMSSVALLEILLECHWRRQAALFPSDRPMDALRAGEADGALLIGDPALQVDVSGWNVRDLGEEWHRMTNLPFVFALWIGPNAKIARQAAPDLVRAMELGRRQIPEIARESARELDLPAEVCQEYLARFIVHAIGPGEMQGYELFRSLLNARERRNRVNS